MEPVFVFEPWQDVLVLLARRYAVFAPKTRQRTVKVTCQMMLKLIRFRVHTIATVSILGVGIFEASVIRGAVIHLMLLCRRAKTSRPANFRPVSYNTIDHSWRPPGGASKCKC